MIDGLQYRKTHTFIKHVQNFKNILKCRVVWHGNKHVAAKSPATKMCETWVQVMDVWAERSLKKHYITEQTNIFHTCLFVSPSTSVNIEWNFAKVVTPLCPIERKPNPQPALHFVLRLSEASGSAYRVLDALNYFKCNFQKPTITYNKYRLLTSTLATNKVFRRHKFSSARIKQIPKNKWMLHTVSVPARIRASCLRPYDVLIMAATQAVCSLKGRVSIYTALANHGFSPIPSTLIKRKTLFIQTRTDGNFYNRCCQGTKIVFAVWFSNGQTKRPAPLWCAKAFMPGLVPTLHIPGNMNNYRENSKREPFNSVGSTSICWPEPSPCM